MKMRQGWSIAFACALGALMGALIAREISSYFDYGAYFAWFGLFLGGVTAWVTVDFREFCSGARRGYTRTINWKPDHEYWNAFAAVWLGYLSLATTTMVYPMIFLLQLEGSSTPRAIEIAEVVLTLELCMLSLSFFLTGASLVDTQGTREKRGLFLADSVRNGLRMARRGNPVAAVFWAGWSVVWVLKKIPMLLSQAMRVGSELKHFAVTTFILVHSQRRAICFVDATIGASVGYFYGSPTIGVLVGAALGFVNYEVVSVRLLRLRPA